MKYLPYVATALTVYGIETHEKQAHDFLLELVATALTVYGIETGSQPLHSKSMEACCNSTYRLRY